MKVPGVRSASIAVIVLLAAVGPGSVVAGAQTQTPARGGTGGIPFNLDCGADGVLVGINVQTADHVNGLEAVCAKVWPNGKISPNGRNSDYLIGARTGGTSGLPASLVCEAGLAVVGIHGSAGTDAASKVSKLGIHCARLAPFGTELVVVTRDPAPTTIAAPGGNDGLPFDDRCNSVMPDPWEMPGRRLIGRSDGQGIRQIQLSCQHPDPQPTPPLTLNFSVTPSGRSNAGSLVTLNLTGAPPAPPWRVEVEYTAEQTRVGDWPDVRSAAKWSATVPGFQSTEWSPFASGTYRLDGTARLFYNDLEVLGTRTRIDPYDIGYLEVPLTLRPEVWPGQNGAPTGLWLSAALRSDPPLYAVRERFKFAIERPNQLWSTGGFGSEVWGVRSLEPGLYAVTAWGERLTNDSEPRIDAVAKTTLSQLAFIRYADGSAAAFAPMLAVSPASDARSDTEIVLSVNEIGAPPPSRTGCSYAIFPAAGGLPVATSPSIPSCAEWPILPALAPGTYNLRLSYSYTNPSTTLPAYLPASLSSDIKNYVVRPTPRVQVTSLAVDPAQPVPGEIVNVRMWISSNSDGTLPKVPWEILKNDTPLRSGVQQWVAAGNTFQVFSVFFAELGPTKIEGHVDRHNELREPVAWRANNSSAVAFTVAAPASPAPVPAPSTCGDGFTAATTPSGPDCVVSSDAASCSTPTIAVGPVVDLLSIIYGWRETFACASNNDCADGHVCSTNPCATASGGTCLRQKP